MEIPSTTKFDMNYKEALQFLWDHPEGKLLLEQGICPYIELPHQTEFIENTIWPASFARLHTLNLLVEQTEIDPKGNGRKIRKIWTLDRAEALAIVGRKKGRPEAQLKAGKALRYLKEVLNAGEAGEALTQGQIERGLELIAEWEKEPK
jgi:alcohol dehydrogenase YqhD (iron-dependent ADH family)